MAVPETVLKSVLTAYQIACAHTLTLHWCVFCKERVAGWYAWAPNGGKH